MKNFFSAIQGKFDAKYDGRYLGNILEQIAAVRPEVVEPLLKVAPMQSCCRWSLKAVQEVTTEVAYLTEDARKQDRRADLVIELDSGNQVGSILVEIKMKDSFLPGQLDEYIRWAKEVSETEYRAVIVLTTLPIKPDERDRVKDNKDIISHIYLSDFMDELRPKVVQSELIALLANYLCEEGYAMYQLQPKKQGGQKVDETDYNALLSFMVLTFLPHESGKGKVVAAKKVARGPAVFGNIVQNWQLVSDRLAVKLGTRRRPTINYFPEQATTYPINEIGTLDTGSIRDERIKKRRGKRGGRYWLTSETVLDAFRLQWGQVLQVQRGKEDKSEDIKCGLFVAIRKGGKQISEKINWLKDGVKNPNLYRVEPFMDELLSLMREVRNEPSVKKVSGILKILNNI